MAGFSNGLNHKIEEFQLACTIKKEEDYFVIESEALGVVGTGQTIEVAKEIFFDEFFYILERYNQLPENKLSDRIKRIKDILNSSVVLSKGNSI